MSRALVLAAVVVLAGCSGLAGLSDDGPAVTDTVATPAPVPTDKPVAYPPGLSASGVNATAVGAAHERALRGASYRWQFDAREARPEFSLGTVYVGPRVTVEASDPRRYAVVRTEVTERGGGLSVETWERTRFAAGGRVLVRDEAGNRSRNVTRNDTGLGSRLAGDYVARFLAVENASVQLFENGTALVRGDTALEVDGDSYTVTAYVGPSGVVRRFQATYVQEERVQFASYAVSIEELRVTPPSRVQNRTASD